MECRTCGREFDPKLKRTLRGGYADECTRCGRKDRKQMYLGRPGATNKGANIEIFRTNLRFVQAQLNREKGAGMAPNIGISHPAAKRGFDDGDE